MYTWDGGRDPNLRLMMGVLSDSEYAEWSNRPDKEVLDKLILAQRSEPDRKKRLALIKAAYEIGRAHV